MENEEEQKQLYTVFSVIDQKGYEFHYWIKAEANVSIQTSGDHAMLTDGELVYLSTFHQSLMYLGLKKYDWNKYSAIPKIVI